MKVKEQYDDVRYKLSDASLQLLPEYQERLKVLRELKYTDSRDTVQLKVIKRWRSKLRSIDLVRYTKSMVWSYCPIAYYRPWPSSNNSNVAIHPWHRVAYICI